MTDAASVGARSRLRPLTVFAISVLAVAVGAVVLAVTLYLQLKRDVGAPRENLQWAAYQLQAEHLRLMLAARDAVAGSIDVAGLDERYQIFVSRVLILRDGAVYAPMRATPGFPEVLAQAGEAIPIVDAALARAPQDAAGYAAIVTRYLEPLTDPLQQVALGVVAVASAQQTGHQVELLDTVSYLAGTLVLIVAASFGLAAVTMKQLTALEAGRRDLAVALRRAEESSQAKSRFLAGMSHEMRTPLNAVIGLLREIGYRSSDDRVRDMSAAARASADMLCGLVDDVIDTTRIETGKFRFQHSTFSPVALMEEVAVLLASRACDQDNRIVLDTAGLGARYVTSDRARLKQVLVNLLGNAVKFTRDGVVTLKAWTAPGQDDMTLLRVSVADTGIGIAADQRDRIFSRFFQAEGGDGLGLGLSISRDIVQRLGGSIGVDSELGRGSTFWFEVPVTATAKPDRPPAPAQLRDRLTGLRILVAEDNATNRQVIRLLLERHGADFHFARDGAEAVAMARAATFDAILMDINMPGMNGLEALAAIRRRGAPGDPPVLALTADALTDDIERFEAAGMAACVTKPIDEIDLLRRLAETLGRPDILPLPEHRPDRVRAPAPTELDDRQRDAILGLIAAIDDEEPQP